jgi:hypothetical protein
MKHLWTIICQQAIINNETKTISLMDVLEEITFKPAVGSDKAKMIFPFKFEIVNYWLRESEKERSVEFLLETIDPSGEKIVDKQYKMDFPSDGKERMRSLIKSDAFIFTVEGQYLFRVKLKEERDYRSVAEIPVEVRLQKTR